MVESVKRSLKCMDDQKKWAGMPVNQKKRFGLWLLGVTSIVIVLVAAVLPPVSQPIDYHQFADRRLLFGVPNMMNVVSNLAVLLSGMAGLRFLWKSYHFPGQQAFMTSAEYWPYWILFTSVIMTSIGSAYYHWDPDNARLFWDRLFIATGVTSLLAAVLAERVHPKLGLYLLPVLVSMGAVSVIYWHWSEQQDAGNLNFYIVIQFYSLLLVVLLSSFLPTCYSRGSDIYKAVALYGVAKVAEMLDQQIYAVGQVISGHTLKHVLAAIGIYWIVRMLQKRTIVCKL